MRKIIVPLFLAVLIMISLLSSAQVVNIENARMQSDTTGWMGNAYGRIGLSQSVDNFMSVNVGAHAQYKSKANKSLWLLLSNYTFQKGGGRKFTDNALVHLRYNYKLNTWLRWEIFTQAQNNLITQMRARILFGTGPRFKILSTKIIRLYAATLVMHEKEKENTSPSIKHNDIRSSSYVSFTITPTDNIELICTTFYQPLFKKISDYRVLNEATLKVKAGKRLSLTMDWDYLHDRFPAGTAPRTTYSFGSGFNYEF